LVAAKGKLHEKIKTERWKPMLSLNTKIDLTKLLEIIGFAEVQIEKMREVLCRQSSFTVDPVFNRIARGASPDHITDTDLLKFLQSNKVEANLRDINLFMADRGTSGEKCIDRADLCNLLVTKTNTKVRNEVYQRQTYRLPSNHFLNFELEYTITRIFEYELNLLREIQHYVQVLSQKSDFSIFDSFQEIDINFTNYYNVKE
jgi:hypothetical protein